MSKKTSRFERTADAIRILDDIKTRMKEEGDRYLDKIQLSKNRSVVCCSIIVIGVVLMVGVTILHVLKIMVVDRGLDYNE